MSFVRRHSLANLENGTAKDWREATLRIFTSKPGTYQSGTNLAVYASAWKDEKDLSDIFVYWNGYAYGKGVAGKESHQNFVNSLKSVDVTYNKVVSDEYDLFGCCYFGTHGGITAAARHLSGKDVKAYYGGLQVRKEALDALTVSKANIITAAIIITQISFQGMVPSEGFSNHTGDCVQLRV